MRPITQKCRFFKPPKIIELSRDNIKSELQQLEADLASTTNWYQLINNPEVQKLILKGNALSPNSIAVVYLNDDSKSVVLNTEGLVALDEAHTYQMWADVEGEMINMGIIPKDSNMVTMSYIDNAESLNITIEPKGGNDHPTVEQLITNIIL